MRQDALKIGEVGYASDMVKGYEGERERERDGCRVHFKSLINVIITERTGRLDSAFTWHA